MLMSYIQPNSRIEFFDDIGISQDYNDTLYFPTLAAKDTYFSNIDRLAHVDRCYYVRERRGYVRVELPMNTMIHAQYMRFQNTSYGLKWWYAFVKDVIYINDNTTEVQFELDPMLTWMGSFTVSPCFVERQHSETDNVGDNLIDEGFDTGEYVNANAFVESYSTDISNTGLFNTISEEDYEWRYNSAWSYMVFFNEPLVIENPVRTGLGIYSGLSVSIYPNTADGLTRMQAFLHTDNILTNVQAIVLIPEKLIPKIPNYVVPYSGAVDYSTIERDEVPYCENVQMRKTFTNIDTYTNIRNNKIFTYPYNFLVAWNGEGKECTYRYELFNSPLVNFKVCASLTEKPEITCFPENYRGIENNYAEGITMHDFPMASWNSDVFMAYLAQTLSSAPVRMLTASTIDGAIMQANVANLSQMATIDKTRTLDSTAFFGATGNSTRLVDEQRNVTTMPVGRSIPQVSMAHTTGDILRDATTHLLQPSVAHGQQSSDVLTILNKKDFYFYRRTIRGEFAKRIDDYWTMYGYPDRTLHVPNMNARQRFTYVKTQACKINCSCPASDANFIEELFNKGIRFWKNHTQIGNYTDDNLPIA